MLKNISFSIIVVFLSTFIFAQNPVNVLFLGNSYTYVNDMPTLIQELAMASGKTLNKDQNTPGGYTLESHSTNTTSLTKIAQGNWDYVILQEQSQIPTIPYHRDGSFYPAIVRLNDSIKKYNPCAQVMLFMTWGRQFGGQQCDNGGNCSPVFVDFSHMQDSLETAYVNGANQVNAKVSPVGIAWKKAITQSANILHSSDQSHPALGGSYLAACVFHAMIWKENTFGNGFESTLAPTVAQYFQQVADSTVFHSYSSWNIDAELPTANFSFNVSNDTVYFLNTSIGNSTSTYLWDFGDGSTSTIENPFHVFPQGQSFNVSLMINSCFNLDDTVQSIQIATTSIMESGLEWELSVSPNPTSNMLTIQSNGFNGKLKFMILDMQGKLLLFSASPFMTGTSLDVSSLESGIYFLHLSNSDGAFKKQIRFVKE